MWPLIYTSERAYRVGSYLKTAFLSSLAESVAVSSYQAATRKKIHWHCSSFVKPDSRFTPLKLLIRLTQQSRRKRRVTDNNRQQTNTTPSISSKFLQPLKTASGVIDQIETPPPPHPPSTTTFFLMVCQRNLILFCHSRNGQFNLKYESQSGNGCLLPGAVARLIFTSIFNEIWCRMQQDRGRKICRAARGKRCCVINPQKLNLRL